MLMWTDIIIRFWAYLNLHTEISLCFSWLGIWLPRRIQHTSLKFQLRQAQWDPIITRFQINYQFLPMNSLSKNYENNSELMLSISKNTASPSSTSISGPKVFLHARRIQHDSHTSPHGLAGQVGAEACSHSTAVAMRTDHLAPDDTDLVGSGLARTQSLPEEKKGFHSRWMTSGKPTTIFWQRWIQTIQKSQNSQHKTDVTKKSQATEQKQRNKCNCCTTAQAI